MLIIEWFILLCILGSAGIGIYHLLKERKEKKTHNVH